VALFVLKAKTQSVMYPKHSIFLLLCLLVACQPASPPPLAYEVALKRCEPVKEKDIVKFDGDCLNGAALPVFSAKDMQGNTVSNEDLRGKLRLLNFWFIECKPCIEELPDLVKLSQRWNKEDFEIIGICRNKASDIAAFLQTTPLPYTNLPDCDVLADEVFQNPFGYPASYLLDENGVILDVYDALKEGNADYQKLLAAVEKRAGK
jgi:peroxiredoxin